MVVQRLIKSTVCNKFLNFKVFKVNAVNVEWSTTQAIMKKYRMVQQLERFLSPQISHNISGAQQQQCFPPVSWNKSVHLSLVDTVISTL